MNKPDFSDEIRLFFYISIFMSAVCTNKTQLLPIINPVFLFLFPLNKAVSTEKLIH